MPIIGAAAGIAGSIINGIQGASAAGKASDALAEGATKSEAIVGQRVNNAQGELNNIFSGDTSRAQPYLDVGSTSANDLAKFLANPFQAPTLEQAEQMPGYQFQLQQGTQAIDENAAANGTLDSGNTGVALENYGQGLAQTDYNNLYNQALQTYQTNLTGLLGGTQIGEGMTGQLGQEGEATGGQTANLQLQGAEAQAQQNNDIAEARASGYLGKANAYSSMIGGITGALGGGFANLDTTGGSNFLEQLNNFGEGAVG